MASGDALDGKWRGNWRMEWVANTLHTSSALGVSSITTADAHISAASSRLNWRPRRFKWARPFRRKKKSGFCACAITFQTQCNACYVLWWVQKFLRLVSQDWCSWQTFRSHWWILLISWEMYRRTNIDHLSFSKCDISRNNRECLFAYLVRRNCCDCAVPPKINQSRNDKTFGDLVFCKVHSFRRLRQKHRSLETALNSWNYRGADNSLAQLGRKEANVSVTMAWISFGALPCRKKKILMTARVSMLKWRASLTCFRDCFLPGRTKDLSALRYTESAEGNACMVGMTMPPASSSLPTVLFPHSLL